MTTKHDVLTFLRNEPRFRERKNKYRGIVTLLIAKYPFLSQFVRETIIDIFTDFATMNREWNKLLQDNIELRGNDYDEKVDLEQQAQQKLGYKV